MENQSFRVKLEDEQEWVQIGPFIGSICVSVVNEDYYVDFLPGHRRTALFSILCSVPFGEKEIMRVVGGSMIRGTPFSFEWQSPTATGIFIGRAVCVRANTTSFGHSSMAQFDIEFECLSMERKTQLLVQESKKPASFSPSYSRTIERHE